MQGTRRVIENEQAGRGGCQPVGFAQTVEDNRDGAVVHMNNPALAALGDDNPALPVTNYPGRAIEARRQRREASGPVDGKDAARACFADDGAPRRHRR